MCHHPLFSLATCLGSDVLFYLAGLCTGPVIGWTLFKRLACGRRRRRD